MTTTKTLRSLLLYSMLATAAVAPQGCTIGIGNSSDDITNIDHTDVERQSIGNCWLYAQASWVESMHLTATGEAFDISQSYWTYWHWYGQLVDGWGSMDEISTGGNQWTSNRIVQERGLVSEPEFVSEDAQSEMSSRQRVAKNAINQELKSGRLKDSEARRDAVLVRQVLNDAWQLTPEVRAYLDQVFGEDGKRTLKGEANPEGTPVIAAENFVVQYKEASSSFESGTVKNTDLGTAIREWHTEQYPNWGSSLESKRRDFQIRVQRALHDGQPVVVTWDVDFNAMESSDNERRGSFNVTTLSESGGPGRQGGHMTVFEDYQAETEEFGLLEAGVTLDPNDATDALKLEALLLPSTKIQFFRIKNSWGAFRDDRASAPGFPGYHDLYMDYLDGPISWCPDVDNKTDENCTGDTVPFNSVMLPPGY